MFRSVGVESRPRLLGVCTSLLLVLGAVPGLGYTGPIALPYQDPDGTPDGTLTLYTGQEVVGSVTIFPAEPPSYPNPGTLKMAGGEVTGAVSCEGGLVSITAGTIGGSVFAKSGSVMVYGTAFAVDGAPLEGDWTALLGDDWLPVPLPDTWPQVLGGATLSWEPGEPKTLRVTYVGQETPTDLAFDSTLPITLMKVVTGTTPPPGPTEIEIDIRPGSDSNRIYVWCPRFIPVLVPVAILSTPDFDATALEPANIFLDGAGVCFSEWGQRYLSTKFNVDGDDDLDLVVVFAMDPEGLEEGPYNAVLSVYSPIEPTTELYQGFGEIDFVLLYH